MRHKTKNIGVRLNDQELLVLGRVPGDNYPEAVRYLIKFWSDREQQAEQIQQIGDRVIAALSMKIDLMKQGNNGVDISPLLAAVEAIRPVATQGNNGSDQIMRRGLAETIRHGLIPLAQMDRRGPLLATAEMLEKVK